MEQFEWDEEKNHTNYQKHGIWFEEAQTLWADPLSAEFFDENHSQDEPRYLRIGHSTRNRVLLAVFRERSDDLIRSISARSATSTERKDYEEGI